MRTALVSDVVVDMKCYDELDPKIKQVIQHLPISNHFCLRFLQMQRERGVDNTLKFIADVIEQHFPGYKPI